MAPARALSLRGGASARFRGCDKSRARNATMPEIGRKERPYAWSCRISKAWRRARTVRDGSQFCPTKPKETWSEISHAVRERAGEDTATHASLESVIAWAGVALKREGTT